MQVPIQRRLIWLCYLVPVYTLMERTSSVLSEVTVIDLTLFTEHLLSAKHCPRCWEPISEQKAKNSCPCGVYIIVEGFRINNFKRQTV